MKEFLFMSSCISLKPELKQLFVALLCMTNNSQDNSFSIKALAFHNDYTQIKI